jgi:hypothetical protein
MHFSFSPQTGHRLQKRFAIRSNRSAQGFIGIEDGAKAKWQDGQGTEAFTDYVSMVQNGLLIEGLGSGVLAYDDGEFSAGTGEHRSVVHASEIFNRHRTPGSDTTLKALLLGNAVRVPRHLSLSWE